MTDVKFRKSDETAMSNAKYQRSCSVLGGCVHRTQMDEKFVSKNLEMHTNEK